MSLAHAFEKSKNLGDLTNAWLRHVKKEVEDRKIDSSIKLQIDNAASLVAPAALVATIVRHAEIDIAVRPVRVLLIGSDPLMRLDHSAWTSFAGDFLDSPGGVQILLTFEEEALTSLNPMVQALGLTSCQVISHEDARASNAPIDLAIWVHPATESLELDELENTATALATFRAGIPTFSTSFNDVDILGQNYLLHPDLVRLAPVGGEIKRGCDALNRFAIATKHLGVDGGWAALISKLEPGERVISDADIDMVRTALQLYCAEGAIHHSWNLGQRVNGVAFNRIIPVGLLGNMAVDTATGHVLTHDEETNELQLIGHLWKAKLDSMPNDKNELLLWSAEVKLSFSPGLSMEDKKRAESISILEAAHARGLTAAGVALARYYEGSKKDGSSGIARKLYEELGNAHPLSAYSLAYIALEGGDEAAVESHLRASAAFGYPVASTDLGKLLYSLDRGQEGLQEMRAGAKAGDAEANYLLGELHAKTRQFDKALTHLKSAYELGHAEAAALALQIATYMLQNNLGKRSLVKREIKEIGARIAKLDRRKAST